MYLTGMLRNNFLWLPLTVCLMINKSRLLTGLIFYILSFLETSVPLLVLIEAAKAGNEKEVEDYAQVFTEHANKLVEVSIIY